MIYAGIRIILSLVLWAERPYMSKGAAQPLKARQCGFANGAAELL